MSKSEVTKMPPTAEHLKKLGWSDARIQEAFARDRVYYDEVQSKIDEVYYGQRRVPTMVEILGMI